MKPSSIVVSCKTRGPARGRVLVRTAEVFRQTALDKGRKIPTAQDRRQTMQNFGKDIEKVKVFDLCHQDHAHQILNKDRKRMMSARMPCRIAIDRKRNGRVFLLRLNSGLMDNMPALHP
jgi:uncharacterized protein (DUF302 family)